MTATEQEVRTQVRAQAKWVRTAPRKAQLVVDQIRGRPVPEARTILRFMTRDAARDVERVLTSAVANAETNHGLVGDDLVVSAAFVGAGPTLKRWRARARGRVNRIRKRTCHITVVLARTDAAPIPEPRGAVTIEPPATTPAPEPEAPAEEAPVAAEAEEEAPKPKRARAAKPKAETAEAATAEEKPKRTRAAKPKADAEAAEGEEKPKRAPRRKKTEESEES